MDSFLPQHPMGYWQLVRKSLQLYFASFTRIILLSILLAIIVFIPRFISDGIGHDIFAQIPLWSFYRLFLIIINLISLVLFVAIIWRLYCVIRGIHEPLVEDVHKGAIKLWNVFIATIIQTLIITVIALCILGFEKILSDYQLLFDQNFFGILLSIIVFVGQLFLVLYVITLFVFLIPLIAIEDKGIISSIKRSIFLVWNHWWRVFSLQLLPWICFLIVLLIIKFAFHINVHIYFLPPRPHYFLTTVVQATLFALFMPWVASLLLVQLKDLELRKHITQQDKNAL